MVDRNQRTSLRNIDKSRSVKATKSHSCRIRRSKADNWSIANGGRTAQ